MRLRESGPASLQWILYAQHRWRSFFRFVSNRSCFDFVEGCAAVLS